MKRSVGYIGAFGLVTLLFGLLGQALIYNDEYHFVPFHLGIGAASLFIFLISFSVGGGLRNLSGRNLKKAGHGFGAVVYTLLFLGVLTLLNLWVVKNDPLHFDSTEQQAYTLAPETLKVLDGLTETVIARSFNLGGKLEPAVQALLKRFEKASPKFILRVIDPEKKPALVDQFGISQSGTIHFSFEGDTGKREAKIARDITEQAVVNAILKIKRGEGKKVYVVTGHGEADLDSQNDSGFLFLRDFIQGENLQLKSLSIGAEGKIPDDASAILVLGPKKSLLVEEVRKIESYLGKGGAAIFASEPNGSRDIANLVAPLGITVGTDVIIERALRGFGVQNVLSQYGVHEISHGLGGSTIFTTASSVGRGLNLGEGSKVTELAFTGENSWAETDVAKIYSENPEVVFDATERRGPVPVVVTFEGPVPYRPEEGTAPEKITRLVVFGDVDFVSNTNIRKVFNADFFLNSLNWVLGEPEGISIRSRTLRESTKIISDEQSGRVLLIAGFLFPEVLVLLGLAIWWRRKS